MGVVELIAGEDLDPPDYPITTLTDMPDLCEPVMFVIARPSLSCIAAQAR